MRLIRLKLYAKLALATLLGWLTSLLERMIELSRIGIDDYEEMIAQQKRERDARISRHYHFTGTDDDE